MDKVIEVFIQPEQQGTYFTVPFEMPEGVESLVLSYAYPRFAEQPAPGARSTFTSRREVNIIDLGLVAPDGRQVGASGADKAEFEISETRATPGYTPCRLAPGKWEILVGAYKVSPTGVQVIYKLHLEAKHRRLLKGDMHLHTLASDGVHTVEELGWKAARHGLDFLAVTDHNQFCAARLLPQTPQVTLIAGVEWTHYLGHANFWGTDQPYDGPFAANTPAEISARFASARRRGALISANHPFEAGCEFKLDLNTLPIDCLEIWNGPMRESNLRAVGLWQSLLAAGRKIPLCGGSDYHRDTPFIFLGGPTTCVFSLSASQSDILTALRQGHAYLTYAPDGPWLELSAGEAQMGDSAAWPQVSEMEIRAGGLAAGDVIRVVQGAGSEVVLQAPDAGDFQGIYAVKQLGFARVEILRAFLPGVPMLPALISNPIYFEPAEGASQP